MGQNSQASFSDEGWKSEEERRRAHEEAERIFADMDWERIYSTEEEMIPLESVIEELEAMEKGGRSEGA